MYIDRQQFQNAYLTIRKHANNNVVTVLILVGPEPDAICASKILVVSSSIEFAYRIFVDR